MSDQPCRVLIVDDHKMIREGLRNFLRTEGGIEVCGEADSVDAALEAIERARPDLAILDLSLVDSNGLDLVWALRRASSPVKTIIFSNRPAWVMEPRVRKSGANGYLRKSTGDEEILEAIRVVMEGGFYLSEGSVDANAPENPLASAVSRFSDREYQVFEYFGRSLEPREIASRMDCSVNSVGTMVDRIKSKVGVSTTADLRRAAIGWQLDALL